MTISKGLMKAILSMDSYNRGYDAGIKFGSEEDNNSVDDQGIRIGSASIQLNSEVFQEGGARADDDISFYAIAYDLDGQAGGESVIAYRGTDSLSSDPTYGWPLGGGNYNAAQGAVAFSFYRLVADNMPPRDASISVTGHSLGGGLAGLVGATFSSGGHHSYIH